MWKKVPVSGCLWQKKGSICLNLLNNKVEECIFHSADKETYCSELMIVDECSSEINLEILNREVLLTLCSSPLAR